MSSSTHVECVCSN